MGAIIPFQFEAHAVRVQVDGAGLPWFNANDVCDALEMGNPSQAIKSHVDGDDLQKLEVTDNLGRTQRANHVNESGLYALILGSTKDAAKRFKRWVTGEVLPAIRKAGSYAAPGALAALAEIKAEDGTSYRAFVTHTVNPHGFPAKDRSGRLEPLEPPDLGALIAKCAGASTHASAALPASIESKE